MPEGDAIVVMWFKVLSQAGKTNDGGYIYLNRDIPYSSFMLSTLFNKPQHLVELAMKLFEQFGMIDVDEKGYIFVTNWEKHQSVDKMTKIKEQTKLRVQNHREKKKLELLENNFQNVTQVTQSNVTVTEEVTHGNETEIDKELDKKITERKHILSSSIQEVIEYLNMKTGKRFSPETKETVKLVGARLKIASIEDCKKVIDVKVKQWKGDAKMDRCLKPNTLFAESNFEAYLNESITKTKESEYVPRKQTEVEHDPYLEAAYAQRGMGKDT